MSEEEGRPGKLRNRWEDARNDAGKLPHKNDNRAGEGLEEENRTGQKQETSRKP